MKTYIQLETKSRKFIGTFWFPEGKEDISQITEARGVTVLRDSSGYFAAMNVGTERLFTGQSVLRRVA